MARVKKNRLLRNEVVINLLPEKAKRDYILRLVSFMIVLSFVIINFFTLFIPNLNRLNKMNDLKRVYAKLEAKYGNLQDIFQEFYHSELYNPEKNNDRRQIEDYQLDLEMVINDINEIISSFDYSEFIFLETVNYNSELKELFIQVQFYDQNHIVSGQNTDFIELLNRIDYILEVDFDEPIPIQVIGEPRAQVQVTLLLDEEAMPKVGDLNEA